jgi:adenosylmethionine-8-amino-7-oxononanoate aminotransferase
VRGRGMMLCVESVANKASKAVLPDAANESKRISDAAEAMGLLLRPLGHLNVMSPPLTITQNDVDFIAEVLEKAIVKVTNDLVREGFAIG